MKIDKYHSGDRNWFNHILKLKLYIAINFIFILILNKQINLYNKIYLSDFEELSLI